MTLCTLKVGLNHNTPPLFEETFSSLKEFHPVEKICQSKRRIGIFESMAITVRADSIAHFCKDFFLPTFSHHALKEKEFSGRVILIPICLYIDFFTLAIRAVTLIFRIYFLQSRKKHPFHQYLLQKGADSNLLCKDSVYVEIEKREKDKNIVTIGNTFHFIDLPENEGEQVSSFSSRSFC